MQSMERQSATSRFQPAARSSWRDRFSQEQLEKKRVVDRLGQRKARRQSKQTVAALEERVRQLLAGEQNNLVQTLMDENAALRAELSRYKGMLEAIVMMGREGLAGDVGGLAGGNLRSSKDLVPTPVTIPFKPPTDPAGACDKPVEAASLSNLGLSIFYQVACVTKKRDGQRSLKFQTNDLFQSIMTWKMIKGHCNSGCEFLIDHFNLNKYPRGISTGRYILQNLSPWC